MTYEKIFLLLSLFGFVLEIFGFVFLYKNDLPDHVLNPLGIRDNKGEMESKRLKDNIKYTLFQKIGFAVVCLGLIFQIPIMAINIFDEVYNKTNDKHECSCNYPKNFHKYY